MRVHCSEKYALSRNLRGWKRAAKRCDFHAYGIGDRTVEVKLTIQERLEDLRVSNFDLTLEQLAEKIGFSRSALGKYESEDSWTSAPTPQ
jgi:transcriptional regulator with XRE-family HTH domain